ncbi:MAG TPA: MFS transporter [Candidatus Acidoferrum sp.]|nr:MFS transporter [Candidatus Acidoferrum sp.]
MTQHERTSGWAPLRRPLFRDRWLASIVSNLGSWMQDTAGTWLMAMLTSSPLLIALMQTAASLPILLLGLLAGATADIFDRRRLLLFWQTWMLVTVAVLSVLTLTGTIGPWTLLGLTFLLNVGSAMNNPAWQAIVPELVPRSELPDAIALNSAGFNLARAVGPALGGLAVAIFHSVRMGAGMVFVLNSLSFLAVIWVLYAWKRTPLFKSALPSERILGSIRAGFRYVRHTPVLQAVLLRVLLFGTFASAVWALLAVVAREQLHLGAVGFGALNGCLGAGAVLGAIAMPRVRHRVGAELIAAICAVVFAATMLVLAYSGSLPLIVLWLILAGGAWTSALSTMNTAMQLSVPAWVQARALGTYQMIFAGGMALGSALWGALADRASSRAALTASAIGILLTLPVLRRLPLMRGTPPDLTPFVANRPAPLMVIKPDPEEGPVLITIEYRIGPEDLDEFTRLIHELGRIRMRDGAVRWGVFQDTANAERLVETFVTDSWLDFLRARERMTAEDRIVRDQIRRLHQGSSDPQVSRMIYVSERDRV